MKTLENKISSREIAEMMGKEHKHILEKIDKLNDDLQSLTFGSDKYWIESSYKAGTGKSYREFQVTELGCELIAHKTIGKDGTAFTVKYMDRFHKMKEIIEDNKPKLPTDYLSALKALVASEEEKQKLQIENKEQKEVLNTFETAKGNILVRELAKIMSKEGISIGEKRLWEKLREWKLVNSKNEPYQKYIDMGVFELKEGVKNNHTYRTLKITGKGQVYIINKFKNN